MAREWSVGEKTWPRIRVLAEEFRKVVAGVLAEPLKPLKGSQRLPEPQMLPTLPSGFWGAPRILTGSHRHWQRMIHVKFSAKVVNPLPTMLYHVIKLSKYKSPSPVFCRHLNK